MIIEKQHQCHNGTLYFYSHESIETKTNMRFSLFIPPGDGPFPYVLFLSGLTCTEMNFTEKAGAYKKAAELGMAVLVPDTSPRGENVPDDEAYDLGQGAGFYLDATQEPWVKNFRMESYLIKELLPSVEESLGLDPQRKSIMGHSMGGHGALTLYFRHKGVFKSCSAFSPIVAPMQVPWGQKVFEAYLGEDRDAWKAHDACELVRSEAGKSENTEILIDQGLADDFLEEQLRSELFERACERAGQKLTVRYHEGYDHSYYFIQSFVDNHLSWHAERLNIA